MLSNHHQAFRNFFLLLQVDLWKSRKLLLHLQPKTPEITASEYSHTKDQQFTLPSINLLLPAWGRENLEKEKNHGKNLRRKHLTLISQFEINSNSRRQRVVWVCLFGFFLAGYRLITGWAEGLGQELQRSLSYTVLIWRQGERSASSLWFLGIINFPVMAVCPQSGGSLLEGKEGRERNMRLPALKWGRRRRDQQSPETRRCWFVQGLKACASILPPPLSETKPSHCWASSGARRIKVDPNSRNLNKR